MSIKCLLNRKQLSAYSLHSLLRRNKLVVVSESCKFDSSVAAKLEPFWCQSGDKSPESFENQTALFAKFGTEAAYIRMLIEELTTEMNRN